MFQTQVSTILRIRNLFLRRDHIFAQNLKLYETEKDFERKGLAFKMLLIEVLF